MEGHLWMSGKERERLKLFERVKRGDLQQKQAAEICGLDYRQTRRLYQRYCQQGDGGLVHRGRGRPSNRRYKAEFREAVLARYQERYPDFGPTLATEKLALDGYVVDHETLRGWLLKAKLWRRRRKRPQHRSWRERRAHFGELVQLDGSHHKWFEQRAPECCLMNMVDDASGTTHSLFAAQETIFAAMELLWQWIDRYGIPRALYTDRKNVYVVDQKTREKAADSGLEALTQFGRACKQLDIRIIEAYSPQAKGRVERNHGTYQDRLVKELRLAEIDTIEPANELLATHFCAHLNRKFAVTPRSTADYHRSARGYDLAAIFCIQEERTITADWIVRFANNFYQLEPQRKSPPAKGKVTAQRYLNGELHFRYRGQELSYTLLPERPQPKSKQKKKKRAPGPSFMEQHLMPANRAWRGFQFGKGSPWARS
jgi:Helix-turn-helix domain